MNKDKYLRQLRLALQGLSKQEIDDICADYSSHFDEASAHGRSEKDTAEALGDPRRLAREHLSSTHYQRWQQNRHPGNLLKWLFASMGLVFALPLLGILALALVPLLAGIVIAILTGVLVGGGTLLLLLAPILLIVAILWLFLGKNGLHRHLSHIKQRRHTNEQNSQDWIEHEIPWTPGQNMTISAPVEVYWRPADTPRAVIHGSARNIENIHLENQHLRGKFNWSSFGNNTIRLELESPALEQWSLVGSGELYLQHLSQPSLRLNVAGSGDIRASGEVQHVSVSIAGSGDVDLSALKQERTTVNIAGSGDATIAPTEEAILSIAGSGDITLLTQPTILKTSIVGSGDIHMAQRKYTENSTL